MESHPADVEFQAHGIVKWDVGADTNPGTQCATGRIIPLGRVAYSDSRHSVRHHLASVAPHRFAIEDVRNERGAVSQAVKARVVLKAEHP